MKIKRVKLQPFGGIIRREVAFSPGLNVVLGPNEAGKSTIFHAIQKVFFTRTRLRKPQFAREMERFIPVGGDTCRVELDFEVAGQAYRLERSWGSEAASRLILADGVQLTDEEEIERRLEELLPANAATFRSALMTYQSGLEKTVQELAERFPETIYSLGDILRQALFETGGVSVDRFQAELEAQHRAYFGRWDRERKRPEGNRGLGNRWLKGTGKVVEAWYRREERRQQLETVRRVEEEIDRTNRILKERLERISEIQAFLEKNRPVVTSLQRRQVLEAEIGHLDIRLEQLKDVNRQWPVLAHRIKEREKELRDLQIRMETLQQERVRAEQRVQFQKLWERFEQARKKQQDLEAARQALRQVKALTDDEMRQIRQWYHERERLESRLQAGELRVEFLPRKALKITVQEDLQAPREVPLKPPKEQTFEVSGRIRLEHPDWQLTVTSRKVDFDALEKRYREVQRNLDAWKTKLGFHLLEEAERLHQDFQEKVRREEFARQALEELLGEETLDSLQQAVEQMKAQEEARPPAVVAEELAETRMRLEQASRELEDWRARVAQYREAYGSLDELLIQVGELTRRRRQLEEERAKLPPLPEEIAAPETFVETFRRQEEERETLEEEIRQLERSLFELETEISGNSAEELEREYREADAAFQQVLRQGEALARVREHTREILRHLDRDTFRELERELSGLVEQLTEGRYRRVSLQEKLPRAFVRPDGKELPYRILSHGTRDVLGLALRLTIGKYFLRNSDGPFILDDPLVDLDPARQQAAARVLREFAAEKQVIIFTCHPTHAELLGGELIELESD